MSKYIKLEDAIDRLNQLYHGYEVEEWLKSLPTIDIVHCGECKHINTVNCPMIWFDVRFDGSIPCNNNNYFCSDGERKDNE